MSKQASPTVIGGFVLGGLTLLIIFVLIIAGDTFFKDERRYVIYFEGSIFGLKVGSNVMFRGVPIGYVSDIDVVSDFKTMEFAVPVYINVDPDSIKMMNPSSGLIETDGASLPTLVGLGLRATLSSESLITGQLYIELDFQPSQPAIYRSVVSDGIAEIPSTPSGIQEVMANAQRFVSDLQNNLDIPKLAQDFSSAVEGLDRLINSEATQGFTTEAGQTLRALQATLDNLNTVIANVEDEVDPIGASILTTLARAESVLQLAETQLSDDSDIAYRLGTTLKEVEAAARAVRLLADQLEQQPESLIKGKQ